jgi:ribosome modulation factor
MTGGPTWTEAWRHECEVRYVCSFPNSLRRHEYLDGVRKQRGDGAADVLGADARALWATGWRLGRPLSPRGEAG